MKIALCVKSPLPSILLADKGGPRKVLGEGLSWPSTGTGRSGSFIRIQTIHVYINLIKVNREQIWSKSIIGCFLDIAWSSERGTVIENM